LKSLQERDFQVSALWYNPNIHPYTEHQKRLEAMEKLAQSWDFPLIVTEGYEMVDFFRAVTGHEGERCRYCYQMRLGRTARIAAERGIERFTTTLLISPYQDHDLIRRVGERVAAENGVEFHFEDFSVGFRKSHHTGREIGLYFQKYCGCIYSEYERFAKTIIK